MKWDLPMPRDIEYTNKGANNQDLVMGKRCNHQSMHKSYTHNVYNLANQEHTRKWSMKETAVLGNSQPHYTLAQTYNNKH